jgi:hypothetical protein
MQADLKVRLYATRDTGCRGARLIALDFVGPDFVAPDLFAPERSKLGNRVV